MAGSGRIFATAALVLPLASLVTPATASPEAAATFVGQLVEHVGALTVDCSKETRDRFPGSETTCATFGAGFSSWKLKTDQFSRRHDAMGRPARESAWTLRGGRYEREYDVVGTRVSVSFDAETHLVAIAYELGGQDNFEPESAAGESSSGVRMAGFGGVSMPGLIRDSRVEPTYPPKAKEQGIEGSVILDAVISKTGDVAELTVLRCRPEGRGFEEAALEAVKQWRYEPSVYRGEPTDVKFTIYLEFRLP